MGKVDSYIVLDFETCGFNHLVSPATEIGLQILHPETLQEITRYGELFKVNVEMVNDKFKAESIPKNCYEGGYYYQGAFNTTGLTIEHLNKNGKHFAEVAKQMAEEFCKGKLSKGYWSKPVLVGHNLSFDIPFLQYLFKQAKLDLSKFVQGSNNHEGVWYPFYKDTMHLAKDKWPVMESYKLGDCCAKAGIELVDAHRAVNDVVSGASPLLVHFLNCMRQNKTTSQQESEVKTRKTFEM